MEIKIEKSWKEKLAEEFKKPYFDGLANKIREKYLAKKVIYPEAQNIFSAFALCPFSQVKVVILGQDPYHGHGQAQGLSFSVPATEKIPPSLRNIYQEIKSDIGGLKQKDGDLTPWTKQGILLLNATLTVEANQPGSHQGLGWEQFTDAVIQKISTEKENVVFLLWGRYAQAKASLIDSHKHLILKAPHPSPFSAYTGFFGCRHFSQTNKYLKETGQNPIDW